MSTFLIGVDGDVTGNPYAGEFDYMSVTDPALLDAASIPPPFDVGARTVFASPLGFDVELSAYADSDAPNQDFVVYDAVVTNTSGAAIDDAYLGIFADWNVGAAWTDDEGAADESLNLVYVFDSAEADAPYFGVAALGRGVSLSGYTTIATTADDAELFEAMTAAAETPADAQQRVAVLGVGPIGFADGETVTRRFAFVGGASLADLRANAALAQLPFADSNEETTPEGTFVLESGYPNPASARATIGFELPTAQYVRLAAYDVLGREVAVLVDGERPAGVQTAVFDASRLASGMYIYRLEAGPTRLAQTISVVR